MEASDNLSSALCFTWLGTRGAGKLPFQKHQGNYAAYLQDGIPPLAFRELPKPNRLQETHTGLNVLPGSQQYGEVTAERIA